MKKFEKIFIHDKFFPEINLGKQLDGYKKAYPEFDPEYILEHCYPFRQETRNWLESIWEKYSNCAEPDFLKRLRKPGGFHPFSWHLYLASVIIGKNYKIQPNKGDGPDLQIKIGNKDLWIEAVVTTPGKDESASGYPKSGAIYNSLDPRVARITNALTEKYRIYKEKYLNKICREADPFIIAINGSETNNLDESRAAEATVYGRGNDTFRRKPNGELEGGLYELREEVAVQKDAKRVIIPTNYFCNNFYEEISGIIYCEQHVINANSNGETPEDNLYLLLNPYAKNQINLKEFNIGKLTYMNKERQIIREYEKFSD